MSDNRWRKSSRSSGNDNSACVEARPSNDGFEVRDSKLGETSPIFAASAADWRGFLNAVAKLPTSNLLTGSEPDGSRPRTASTASCRYLPPLARQMSAAVTG